MTDAPPPASPVAPDAFRRFWHTGRGYWFSLNGGSLIGLLAVIVVLQLLLQYRLNLWNRDFFNALGARAAGEIWNETRMLLVLVAASVALSVTAVWGRMTFQRRWRNWLTGGLIGNWLADQHYQRVGFVNGQRQNAEYRITEDARIATEAPIKLPNEVWSETGRWLTASLSSNRTVVAPRRIRLLLRRYACLT